MRLDELARERQAEIERAFAAPGERRFGEAIEGVELKALYSRAIGPYFNLQAGVRQDLGVGPDRTHAVIGIEGLAPYWFEVDAYLYLSTQGEVRASASAEYDQRITQRLILQPKVEFDLSAQDIPELGIGSGLTSAEFVRLSGTPSGAWPKSSLRHARTGSAV